MRLVHLTDPHLTSLSDQSLGRVRGKRWLGYLSWKRKRRFRHRQAPLALITEAVRAECPGQILVSGDLAQIGLPDEIAAATAWLESLGTPDRVALVPGNHDYYRADSWPAVRRHWGQYLSIPPDAPSAQAGSSASATFPWERRLEGPGGGVTLVGLCSAYPAPLLMADGRLGADQLARLDSLLERARGFRCLMLHHPPLPGLTAWRKALRDAAQLGSLIKRHQPELVLHGHVHRNRVGPVLGPSRVFATASASSAEPGIPASYRVFDIVAVPEDNGAKPVAGAWSVVMRLKGLGPDGRVRVLAEDRWRVPFRQASGC